ncbi:cohesin subunit SA-1 isoform X2 [Amphiprion ocellaris]|uniref:Cohesin subunit SA n=1 Tax=Amphiprion ocellaris TaxID=80972 RepID=A0AAQ5ZYS0_AMPOC|nr:cohesin subunit SA-1 isoform X2 [Amphiprion ocellaris]
MVRRSSPLDSPEELDDFSDSGSDYEATLKASKRRKRPVPGPLLPKRPRRNAARRVTSSPSNNPIPTPPPDPSLQQQPSSQETPRQVSLRPGRSVDEGKQGISAKDIYDAICSGKSAMVTVVDEWLDSYKQSREAGLLVLINFIVQSCGCKGVVTQEMFGSMENAEIISSLTKEFDEDSVNYPLCTPVPQLKHFKASLCEFARVLVRSCQNSLIYDEYLFPSLLSLLTGLSDSQVRAFRHTSTLLAMKLMTGFVDIVVVVSVQLQTTQRRYDVENSKREHDRASDRLEELQATVSECIENKEELSSMMNSIFRGVFVHRYRDRLPEIRAVCIEELGIWLKTDPEDFLNDGCLKYLGWNLHDKQGPVRLQCVRTLQGLYQEKEFIGRLELFTSRFKERILSMVLDKDPDVAVEVVNLCLLMQQKTEEGLAEDECGHIYPLVYASHRALASAAGVFLYNKLKSVIGSDNQEDNKSNNAAFLQVVISFYIQSEFHEHGAYLVDSLWGVAGSELRDWETMTAFLLQDAGLMYEEEGPLIELMMCAIKQAAQATPPVGRTQGKKILSMKDKKIQEQDRRRITAHFIPLLPQLLAKYSADAGKVSLLLKAPLYFELEMYSSAQWLEKHLDLLLSQICGIVEKHTELTVLEACAHLVTTLCSESYTFSSRAHVAFSQLLDGLTECFSSYLSDLLQGTADDDDTYSAATALKRIAALSSAKDPTGRKLFDSCLELLESGIKSIAPEKELLVSALKCAGLHLMWAKVNAVNSKPAKLELMRLNKEVRSFCQVCQTCLSVNQTEIRDQAFEVLCDLLLLYSESSVRSKPALQALVHLPSDSLRSELAAFLLDYIFIDAEDTELEAKKKEETEISLLQRKRNQLAGYCKLIIYGVLDLTAATDVFKHYSKLFSEMLTDNRSREDLPEIRDLAKRLAMSFGINLHRVRKPLLALHMNGICFAFRDSPEGEEQHLNVDFLEILSEFSFKLLQQDRTQLADFLKSRCPSAALSWPSVRLYQHSLVARSTSKPREQEEGGDVVSSYRSPVAKRKRTAATGSVSSTAKGSWLTSISIHSNLPSPAFTSTVQKQPTKQPVSRKPRATESDVGTGISELESEDEFSSVSRMRKVKPTKRRMSTFTKPTLDQQDLNSHLNLLSLIEDGNGEREEAEIEDYESDSDPAYTLPSTRHTSASFLDELFD